MLRGVHKREYTLTYRCSFQGTFKPHLQVQLSRHLQASPASAAFKAPSSLTCEYSLYSGSSTNVTKLLSPPSAGGRFLKVRESGWK